MSSPGSKNRGQSHCDQKKKTRKTKPRFPADKMEGLMEAMKCMDCGFFPSPEQRFMCQGGHLLCASCGVERKLKHGGKCIIEIPPKEVEVNDVNRNELKTTTDMKVGSINGKLKLVPNGAQFAVCQNTIELRRPDPFFSALWSHASWRCPVLKNKVRCPAMAFGSEIYNHVNLCLSGQAEN